MKNARKLLSFMVAMIAILAVVAGCGSTNNVSKDSKEADGIKVLKVGTNATFAPFEYANDKTQQLEGFDIDVINEVAKRINAHVEFKNIPFDTIIPALMSKDIDIAATGMTITKERSEKVTFSTPYYESGLAVLVSANSDLKDASNLTGKTIAVQMGTTGADLAHTLQGVTIKEFNHSSDAILELKNGGADAVITDTPIAQYYVNIHPDDNFKVLSYPMTKKYFGLALNKDNKELIQAVNQALLDMKKDGELNRLYNKWFKADMPGDMPVVYEPQK